MTALVVRVQVFQSEALATIYGEIHLVAKYGQSSDIAFEAGQYSDELWLKIDLAMRMINRLACSDSRTLRDLVRFNGSKPAACPKWTIHLATVSEDPMPVLEDLFCRVDKALEHLKIFRPERLVPRLMNAS